MSRFSIRNPYFIVVVCLVVLKFDASSQPVGLVLGTGSKQYAPMARTIIGGLTSSLILTMFIVPAAYLLVYGKTDREHTELLHG